MSAFSSSSSSLHFFTQKPKFSVVEHISTSINNTHFNFKINNSINPIKSKPHFPISSLLASFSRISTHFSTSAVSDGAGVVGLDEEAELSAEEEIEEDEENEGGESLEKEGDGVVDEPKSIEDGRLYVGNLPFSMTPSQLSEIFAEAGKVANVEVCFFVALLHYRIILLLLLSVFRMLCNGCVFVNALICCLLYNTLHIALVCCY